MKKILISASLVVLLGILMTGCMATRNNNNDNPQKSSGKATTESQLNKREYFDAFKKEYSISDTQIASLFSLHDEIQKERKEVVSKILDGNFTAADLESLKANKIALLKKVFTEQQINKFIAKIEALHGKDFLQNQLNKFYEKRTEIIKELNITTDQQAKIKTIILNNMDKCQKNRFGKFMEMHKNKFFGGHNKKDDHFIKGFMDNKKEVISEIKKVLTPEQIAKLDKYIETNKPENLLKTELKLTDEQIAKLKDKKAQFISSVKVNLLDYLAGKIDIAQYNTRVDEMFNSLKEFLNDEQITILKDKVKNHKFGFFMHTEH